MGGVWSDSITIIPSTVGGGCIGLSALMLLQGAGEVLAFTSLMGTFTSHPITAIKSSEEGWKVAFMSSFLLTTQVLVNIPGFMAKNGGIFDPVATVPLWVVAVSGLLAGYGTKMANGCTSGHGISGVGRLSLRSIVAVMTFMGTAFFTASFCSPTFPRVNKATRITGDESYSYYSKVAVGLGIFFTAVFCLATILNVSCVRQERNDKQKTKDAATSEEPATLSTKSKDVEAQEPTTLSTKIKDVGAQEDEEAQREQKMTQEENRQDAPASADANTKEEDMTTANSYLFKIIAAMCSAPIFAFGLAFGGMSKPSKIIGFFDLTGFTRSAYDPSLMFLFAAGCAVSFVAYQFVQGHGLTFVQRRLGDKVRTEALSGDKYNLSERNAITKSLVIGSALFGISLGIAGFCPTPSLIMAIGGYYDAFFIWLPLFIAGRFLHMFCFGEE